MENVRGKSHNEKKQPKNTSLEKVQVAELGKASELTLGGRHSGSEGTMRPTPRYTEI